MKNSNIFFIIASFFLITSCSKDSDELKSSDIPKAVEENFNNEYPNSQNAEWEKEGDYYEVEFETGGVEKTVVYDKNGSVISTEIEIAISKLPATITNYINKNHSDYTIEEAEREENKEGIFYEVELEKEDDEIELIFNSEGKFINAEQEDDDD